MRDRQLVWCDGYGTPLGTISAAVRNSTVLSVVASDEEAVIETDRGKLRFFHQQDCCERVNLADGGDELPGIVGKAIVLIEELSNDGAPVPNGGYGPPESYTWTFYRIVTSGPDVTLRWLGESSGYYSESVSVAWTPCEESGEDEEDAL